MLVPKLFTTLRQYDRKTAISDVTAGVIVGVVALPLSIAFAIASGLPPQAGLYTAIIAGAIVAVLGGAIKFIPHPVVTGFTSGIALIIFTAQLRDLLGLDVLTMPAAFLAQVGVLAETAPTTNGWAPIVGLLTILTVVY